MLGYTIIYKAKTFKFTFNRYRFNIIAKSISLEMLIHF